MKPRRQRDEQSARRLMEETPQEPMAADPDEEGETQRESEDEDEGGTP